MTTTKKKEESKTKDELKIQLEKSRLEFIDSCKEKSEEISKILSKDSSEKVKIKFEVFTETDDDSNPTGNFLVAYIREPHFLNAIKALDYLAKGNMHQAGYSIFDVSVLQEYSSPSINKPKYMLGLLPLLGLMLDVQAPDVKKS